MNSQRRLPRKLKKELIKVLTGRSKSFQMVDTGGSFLTGSFPTFVKRNGKKEFHLRNPSGHDKSTAIVYARMLNRLSKIDETGSLATPGLEDLKTTGRLPNVNFGVDDTKQGFEKAIKALPFIGKRKGEVGVYKND